MLQDELESQSDELRERISSETKCSSNDAESSSDDVRSKSDVNLKSYPLCAGCEIDMKKIPAHGFCVSCADYLCDKCIQHHRKVKITRNHVIEYFDPHGNKSCRLKQEMTDMCGKSGHEDKVIEYLCEHCEQVLCSVCLNTDHRQCKSVIYLLDIVDRIDDHPYILDFSVRSASLSQTLLERHELTKNNLIVTDHCHENALRKIARLRKAVDKYFDGLEKKAKDEVENIKRSLEERNNIDSEKCLTIIKQLESVRDDVGSKHKEHKKVHQNSAG